MPAALEVLRVEIGAPIRIAANGGYRSPAHARSRSASPHCWGTAANIYRIGSDYIDSEETISRYADVAARSVELIDGMLRSAALGGTEVSVHDGVGRPADARIHEESA